VSAAGVLKGFHDVVDELRKVRSAVRPLYSAVGVPAEADEEHLVHEVLALLERYDDVAKAVKNEDAVAADIADRVMKFVSKDIEQLAEAFHAKRRVLEEQVEKLQKEAGEREVEMSAMELRVARAMSTEQGHLEQLVRLKDHIKNEQSAHAKTCERLEVSRASEKLLADTTLKLTTLQNETVDKLNKLEEQHKKALQEVAARDALIESMSRSRQLDMASIREFVMQAAPPEKPDERPKPMSFDEVRAALPWSETANGTDCTVTLQGHTITVKANGHTGFNSGRPRFLVACETCEETLHENTTGPAHYIYHHLREALEAP
jgi:hypothetical protein